jgi:peptidoglycan/LPS O-acetylase OafA/YrhL
LRRRTSSGRFIAEVDGLRFLAIAPVVLHHLTERVMRDIDKRGTLGSADDRFLDIVPSGLVGVELFFVISGFIICLPWATRAMQAPTQSPGLRYKPYILRRVTRLEPPYLLTMFGIFAGVSLLSAAGFKSLTEGGNFAESSVSLPKSLAASTIYMHGLFFQENPRLNPPAWSLEIEFQFYIIAPLLILLFLAVGRRLGSLWGEFLTLGAIAVAMRAFAAFVVPEDLRPFLLTGYIEFFLLGFGLSRLYACGYFSRDSWRRIATPLFIGGIVVALTADYVRDVSDIDDFAVVVALLVAFAALFIGSFGGGIGGRFTSLTWITVIGGMCYSIYLIHLMFLQVSVSILGRIVPVDGLASGVILYGVVLIPALLVVSATFFVLVEKPCMDPNWPRKFWNATFGRKQASQVSPGSDG